MKVELIVEGHLIESNNTWKNEILSVGVLTHFSHVQLFETHRL